ncbi:integral membrane sensor signal transduction histidine kinase [Dehalogenimonas lykanthroporepellens BL-DC-9]|jgi:signal transduction histidine kinase|nr:integral membrane sensor signal transduction histidine kinase [Dehalogenimonas lykanthroporepellens BL-DC-9]
MLLPVTYAALVFGIRAGLLVLLIAVSIIVPNLFILEETITSDDIIEIIGIVIIGLVVNLWLESYETDKRHRQMAYLRLENAQRELQRMQQNLRFYLKQITIAQEEERRRIAQELHDDTAQDLIAISRKIDGYMSLHPSLSSTDEAYFEDIHQHLNRTLSSVRRFSQDLRPSVLDDLGLIPAIEWMVPELDMHFKYKTETEVIGRPRRFPAETELVLFRIVQESMRNIGKHATATRVWLNITFNPGEVKLTIRDNGRGFVPPDRIGDLAVSGKLGLTGMQERARLIGAHLNIDSSPGQGSTVTVILPTSPQTVEHPY